MFHCRHLLFRCIQPQLLEPNKLDAFYFAVTRRIKDSFDWPGEIVKKNGNRAWIGEVPLYRRRMADFDSKSLDVSSFPTPKENFEEIKESAQAIASYQENCWIPTLITGRRTL